MAHPDLSVALQDTARAFQEGQEHRALTLLGRVRDAWAPGSLQWAHLERLRGLLLIHMVREVEGTFALERADAALDRLELEGAAPAGGDEALSLAWLLALGPADGPPAPGSLESP